MDIAKEKPASDLTDRCKGAIWGQFIGDAACLGVHLLSPDELKQKYPQGAKGFDQPSQGVEGKQAGDLTHYGEAALLMLQSVSELGYFSAPDFGPRFVAHFGDEEYRGPLDNATKGTIEKYRAHAEQRRGASYHFQGGADDDGPATATRLAPVVVNRFHQGSLLKVAENATRVCQDNQRAVVYTKCHAVITKELLAGSDLRDAVKTAANAIHGDGEYGKEISIATESLFGMLDKDVREVTKQFGQGSSLKSCLPAAIHCALKYQNDFRRAVVETANAGGDSAARAALIGTWLGALHGVQGIPEEWRNQLRAKDKIEQGIEKVVARIGK